MALNRILTKGLAQNLSIQRDVPAHMHPQESNKLSDDDRGASRLLRLPIS